MHFWNDICKRLTNITRNIIKVAIDSNIEIEMKFCWSVGDTKVWIDHSCPTPDVEPGTEHWWRFAWFLFGSFLWDTVQLREQESEETRRWKHLFCWHLSELLFNRRYKKPKSQKEKQAVLIEQFCSFIPLPFPVLDDVYKVPSFFFSVRGWGTVWFGFM